VLEHERVPFVSYPYEWSFGMLREAALLQLEVLLAALDEGLTVKDASPYNVQWRGSAPLFVDVGSFERAAPGEPWAGYRQFCSLFLYPLLLQAYRDVPFQPWLRGRIDGIPPAVCRQLLSARDVLRPGVLSHVYLHSRLERRHEGEAGKVRADLRSAGFGAELIKANARRLERLVRRLRRPAQRSAWSGYRAEQPYDEADALAKDDFVRAALGERRWGLVWDLGANDGRYARLAAEHADYVVAMDADEAVVDELHAALAGEGSRSVLPLVVDVVDPSPALGWRGRERRTLAERGRPDLTLCLALVHHLTITANVPVREVLEWLAGLGSTLVIELATRDDPMVRRLLAAKRPGLHEDYGEEQFERVLAELFTIRRRQPLPGGTRTLYVATPGP
jgi:SAM-dependent methyltransferase